MKKINPKSNRNLIFVAAAIVVYALIAYGMNVNLLPRATQTLVIKACYNVILALSLGLIVGFWASSPGSRDSSRSGPIPDVSFRLTQIFL